MPQIKPLNPDQAGDATPVLAAVKQAIGVVPNIYATMAHSPSALKGFLAFGEHLNQGMLSAAVREQIALTVAGVNHCDYCASAHTALARGAGINDEEAARNLRGEASDPRIAAILKFTTAVVRRRGEVDIVALDDVRAAGISDAELVEIIAHVGLNLFTNYFNHIAETDVDFPLVRSDAAQRAA